MIREIDLEQGTQDWLDFRKNYIGASEAPIVMGVNPWTTPNMLWRTRLGLLQKPNPNDAMLRGNRLEPIARDKFIEETGIQVKPKVLVNDSYNWLLASYDGISNDNKYAVEIKCPGRTDHECAMDGVIPEKYIPQLAQQMLIADLSSIFYFSFNETSYRILEINRSSYDEKSLLKATKQFWEDLNDLREPPLCDKDFVIQQDQEWYLLTDEWKRISAQRKDLEEKEENLRNLIVLRAKDRNVQGNGVRVSKIIRKGNVEYKGIPQLMGIDLEQHRKPPILTYRISEM